MFVHHASVDGMHYVSPYSVSFLDLHEKFFLTRQQSAELTLPVTWQIQPLFYREFAEHLLSMESLPAGDLSSSFVDFCNEKYGGSTGGPNNRMTTYANGWLTPEQRKKALETLVRVPLVYSAKKFKRKEAGTVFKDLLADLRDGIVYSGGLSGQKLAGFIVSTMQVKHPILLTKAELAKSTNTWETVQKEFPGVDHCHFEKALDSAAASLTAKSGYEVTQNMAEHTICEGIRNRINRNKWDHRFTGQSLLALRRDESRNYHVLRLSANGEARVVPPMAYRQPAAAATPIDNSRLDICCQIAEKPWGSGKRFVYRKFKFRSPAESLGYLRYVWEMLPSQQKDVFSKMLQSKRTRGELKKEFLAEPFPCTGSEMPPEYSFGPRVVKSIRSKLLLKEATLLDHPVEKRPPLPDTPEFSFLKNYNPVLDTVAQQELRTATMNSNPPLTDAQMRYYKKKVGWYPTRWSPRILKVGDETAEPKDSDTFVGNSGDVDRRHKPSEDGDSGHSSRKKRNNNPRRTSKSNRMGGQSKGPNKVLSCPLSNAHLYRYYIFAEERRIRISLRSTAIEIVYGVKDDLDYYNMNYYRVQAFVNKRRRDTWIAEVLPSGKSLARNSVMGVVEDSSGPNVCQSGVIAVRDDRMLLYGDKKSAARALYMNMIFRCHCEETMERRREVLMTQVLRQYPATEDYHPDKYGYTLWPVFDNGCNDDWPLFFYATKGNYIYMVYDDWSGKMKEVSHWRGL